jgi:WD repeat-containing protein 42A
MTHKFAVEPGSPNIFISCSGDGTCRLFDLRTPSTPSVLVDWRHLNDGRSVEINSVDINPSDYNYVIVGGGDPHLRLYDRRMIKAESSSLSCVKQYCPQKITEKSNNQSRYLPIHITGVRYNYSGSEFIGTYSGSNIFSFDQNAEDGEDKGDGKLISDYKMEYSGHRNLRTVKEVNFLGPRDEFVVSGSDDGNVFIWEKESGDIVQISRGDKHIVNCLDPHPVYPLCFASSGIEYDIKIWEPIAEAPLSQEMQNLEKIIEQNQKAQGHSSLLLPASFVVNLMNMMSDSDEEQTTPEPENRRRLARIISQLTMNIGSDESDAEEEEESAQGTQCRTQ